jgi:hypothetical protein
MFVLVSTYKDCSWIEDHTLEWAVIDILVIISDVNSPFSGLLRLKRRIKRPVLFAHWNIDASAEVEKLGMA